MAAATETAPFANGTSGDKHQTFVNRVANIPIVADTITQVHTAIQSNSYSAAAYNKAGGVATHIYKATEPIQTRFQPHIEAVDGIAQKSLDYVQGKFPYPFEASSGEIIGKARQPADNAIEVARTYAGVAQSKFAPLTEQVHSQLQQASATLTSLQERLSQAIAALPRSPSDAQQAAHSLNERVHTLSASFLTEFEKLRDSLQSQTKDLPSHVQSAVHPLFESLQKGVSDIRTELAKKDVPITTKANNIISYSRQNAEPVLKEAIEAVKALISKTRAEAKDGAEAASHEAKSLASKANGSAK